VPTAVLGPTKAVVQAARVLGADACTSPRAVEPEPAALLARLHAPLRHARTNAPMAARVHCAPRARARDASDRRADRAAIASAACTTCAPFDLGPQPLAPAPRLAVGANTAWDVRSALGLHRSPSLKHCAAFGSRLRCGKCMYDVYMSECTRQRSE
jgi:hypothetical protein